MFITDAYAQAAEATSSAVPGGDAINIFILIAMFVVFWFLLIRPQQKRAKEHKNMVEALSKGDEVVIQSGIAGKISEINDNFIKLEIAPNTQVSVQKGAVASVLPKGTLKTL